MNRVRGLGTLPIYSVAIAIINESARIEALANLGIPFHDPRVTYGDSKFDPVLFEQANSERRRLVSEWSGKWSDERSRIANILEMGSYGLNLIIGSNEEEAGQAVQATMAAMLIGLWTAFESLAQDAWIMAVNLRPNPLATRILNRNADLGTGTQLKSIPPDQIIGHDFDLRRSMGTMLFRLRAVDFQQLKTARAAYKVAFASQLEPIFEQHHLELFRLESVRNLFVHKGGIVDHKFVERMGDEPDMKETIGQSLLVHGEYVAKKAKVVVDCSTQLVQAVDKWMLENPAVSDGDGDS